MNELSAPLHVDLSLTGRCQLRCDYCSAAPLSSLDIQFHDAYALISELGDLGVFSLLLTGGEPTIHKNFLELAAHASRLIPNVTINTNGLKLAQSSFLAAIVDKCPKALFAISLDAVDPTLNDLSRGHGGIEATEAIEKSSRAGLRVCLSSVLTEATLDHAHLLVERFFPAVKTFRFFPKMSRAQSELNSMPSSYFVEVHAFYRRLRLVAARYPGVKLLTPLGDLANTGSRPPALDSESNCICVHTRVFVDSDLHVYPCFYSANRQNCMGSYPEATFAEIWAGSKAKSLRNSAESSHLCKANKLATSVPIRFSTLA
jgi:MoaA/NifB/PqqE/SkfB family radical SAM enzyme